MDAEIDHLEVGKASCTEEVHFTGGLRGLPVQHPQGWALTPVPSAQELDALVFRTPQELSRFVAECGIKFIGSCIKYRTEGSHIPMDVWEPGRRDPQNNLHAADSWGAVSFRAQKAGDIEFADCASYVSVCLKTAGLRLRDVSNGYHDQLEWALLEKNEVGRWFSNAALLDLYADFHSLVSELCSARDHLAKLAAIQAGAGGKVDSLARLEAWAGKSANAKSAQHAAVALLLSALGTEQSPGWLRRLGDMRNEMLHRVPMGENPAAAGLELQEIQTRNGPIRTIRMAARPSESSSEAPGPDPLIELTGLSQQFEGFARAAWKLTKYPAKIPELVAKD